jgi:hypothetical protein
MKSGRRITLLSVVALLALTQLTACAFPLFNRIECIVNGGTWRREFMPNGEIEDWCERATPEPARTSTPIKVDEATAVPTPQKPTPAPTPTTGNSAECIAPANTYSWAYEDIRSSSGKSGITCNARFVFTNTGSESLSLVEYRAFDNGTLKNHSWGTYQLKPGETHEEQVNRANYKDGTSTFSRIDSLLVIRDVPACAGILGDDSQAYWETQSTTIEDFPCK